MNDRAMDPVLARDLVEAYLAGEDEGYLSGMLKPTHGPLAPKPPVAVEPVRTSVLARITAAKKTKAEPVAGKDADVEATITFIRQLGAAFLENLETAVRMQGQRKKTKATRKVKK